MFRSIASDFKAFVEKGSAIDMAVGFITGAAVNALVNSLVKDILTPPIGLLAGGLDFSALHIPLFHQVKLNVGSFINASISFIITMFAIFIFFRAVKKVQHRGAAATKECPYCKMKIPMLATRCPDCTSIL
ncbi:MAG: large conductance mechanosensitive channel protein MscL [Rickettsiales bacterium]|jgi:large conductance mechanosensitive channel|nr:large conductance mechanosensitive channel protein MscL [Rickettsiales bacterium]